MLFQTILCLFILAVLVPVDWTHFEGSAASGSFDI